MKTEPARGYPLIALFLVLTACGVVAALVAPALRTIFDGKIGAKDAVTACIVSSVCIMALGGIIGLFHFHRGRGFLLGIITGGAVGIFVGPMVMAPREALGTIVGLSVGGSAIVVLVAVAYRISNRSATRIRPTF
jgi:hypothetical protein